MTSDTLTMDILLTKQNIYDFWDNNSVPMPNNPGMGMLSTAGVRKLILTCFNLDNSEIWKKLALGYAGIPLYPFWEQTNEIKQYIITMLDSNPWGKQFIDELLQQLIQSGLNSFILKNYREKKW